METLSVNCVFPDGILGGNFCQIYRSVFSIKPVKSFASKVYKQQKTRRK